MEPINPEVLGAPRGYSNGARGGRREDARSPGRSHGTHRRTSLAQIRRAVRSGTENVMSVVEAAGETRRMWVHSQFS